MTAKPLWVTSHPQCLLPTIKTLIVLYRATSEASRISFTLKGTHEVLTFLMVWWLVLLLILHLYLSVSPWTWHVYFSPCFSFPPAASFLGSFPPRSQDPLTLNKVNPHRLLDFSTCLAWVQDLDNCWWIGLWENPSVVSTPKPVLGNASFSCLPISHYLKCTKK